MKNPLSADVIARVKATVPALTAHGDEITAAMYARLFEDEHIAALFNLANQGKGGAQAHALAGAVLGYARNIDNLGALGPVVERIAQKHIGFHILPEHYPYVAKALLAAIADVLGAVATPDILAAWGEAFWVLADILKDRESRLRRAMEATDGGWTGWRRFRISDRIRESDQVTTFVLHPSDGKAVITHKPGQYLTLRFAMPGNACTKRNYSISCAPNGSCYRISIKREDNGRGGSLDLHQHANIGFEFETTPPAGDFFLADQPPRSVVLLSGGVGLTPMVSMAETIATRHKGLECYYVHGTMNSATHAMAERVRTLASEHAAMKVITFYSDPVAGDEIGRTHDVTGMPSIDWLQNNVPLDDADIYLCGPKLFLRAFVGGLSRAGIHADRVHYEFFGPADELLAA
ncbi:NO-inducible flavohemoprotein [Sphingosinicellaceae bacterium]|nr:NO-inducible flavohemoprotein [Sphingosinicellaceae bacterium]